MCVVLGKDSVDHVLNYFDGQLEALKEGAVLATVSLDGKESAWYLNTHTFGGWTEVALHVPRGSRALLLQFRPSRHPLLWELENINPTFAD